MSLSKPPPDRLVELDYFSIALELPGLCLPLVISTDIQAKYAVPAQGHRLFGAWGLAQSPNGGAMHNEMALLPVVHYAARHYDRPGPR
jgi:hypothetical protein